MRAFLITCFLFLAAQMNAQSDTILSKFNANVIGEKVLLSWRIKAGNTCNGIEVYRSTDSVNYTWIGNVEGICGNLSFPVDYEFFDESPVPNAINYYKLNLGNNGFSRVASTWYFDLSERDHLLSPNPVMEFATLRFKNDSGLKVDLKVFDLSGKLIFIETTNSDNFILQTSEFDPGEYLFQIWSEDPGSEPICGKVVFVH